MLRLIASTTATVGTLLLGVILVIFFIARETALNDAREDLQTAFESAGPRPDVAAIHQEHPDLSATLFSSSGKILAHSGNITTGPVQGLNYSPLWISKGMTLGDKLLVISTSWVEDQRSLRQLAVSLEVLWPIFVGIVAIVAFRSAKSTFHPLNQLVQQTKEISGADLSERLTVEDRAEFGVLATTLNELLDRLESAARREEQFSQDAAHELRTPLAIMRTQIEATLLSDRSGSDYRSALAALLAEVDRISRTTESLLLSAASLPGEVTPLQVDIVNTRVESWQDKFEEAGLTLVPDVQPGLAAVLEEEINVVIDNMLANALKYSVRPSETRVSLSSVEGKVELMVQNGGPPLSNELRDQVFHRFVRGETSRNSSSGGIGIGLAICARIVESRGGQVGYRDTELGPAFYCQWPSVTSATS